MKMITVNKVQFTRLNNKRYHLWDRIISLPYGHSLLSKIHSLKFFFKEYIQ